jgi:hypothetical protein
MPRSRVSSLTLFRTPRRRRWNADEARAVLERLDASGLAVKEFAASEDLDPQRLYRWRAQLHGKRPERAEFVEVVPARSCMEVVSPSGHIVRLPEAFSEDTLRRVLAVLDERPPRC